MHVPPTDHSSDGEVQAVGVDDTVERREPQIVIASVRHQGRIAAVERELGMGAFKVATKEPAAVVLRLDCPDLRRIRQREIRCKDRRGTELQAAILAGEKVVG